MKKREWEKRFLKALKSLTKYEREEALEYYREMYGDKADSGLSEREILREFGLPERCAERILNEQYVNRPAPTQQEKRVPSPAEIVGLFFVFLLLGLPLTGAALSVIVSFFAVAVSGVAVSVAGVLYAIIAPLATLGSLSTPAVFAHVGLGVAAFGVGAILFATFGLLTKNTAIGCKKAFVYFFTRRKSL